VIVACWRKSDKDFQCRPPSNKGLRPSLARRALSLYVSREQLRRAVLIGQALVAEAERRGYEIHAIKKSYNHRAGIALVVRGHAYAFEIVGMTDRLSMTET
jgi:hypothetical protein